MGTMKDQDGSPSHVSKAFNEAIELSIEGRSPYPRGSTFVDADAPNLGPWIEENLRNGSAVVLVSRDGKTEILRPSTAA
jgi:hypothetical protein